MSAGVIAAHYDAGGSLSAYAAAVLADNPLAYYRLGEASGTTILDSSGNGRSGTLAAGTLGAASLLPSDPGNTAVTNPTINIPDGAWMDTNQATVKARVKFTAAHDTTNGDAIVSRYGSGSTSWLLWRNTTNHLAAQISVGGTARNVAATATVVTNQTYEVGFTYDGATLLLYVDGAQAASLTVAGAILQGTQAIELGRYSASDATKMPGVLDEVAIWGTALSGSRMSAHVAAA
jgi:hypothetical protein